jgi:uncharacterized protein (DUF2141 family)
MTSKILKAFLPLLALIAAGSLPSAAALAGEAECLGPPGPSRLLVTLKDMRSSDGIVAATLYPDDPHRFLVHHGQIYVQHAKAEAPATHMCLWLPETDVAYALIIYHDANANHKFDRTAIGIPKEGFGLSNDPPVFMGLPTFKSVRFKTHAGDNAIQIRMRYP